MGILEEIINLDYSEIENKALDFIRRYVSSAGVNGAVLGLSGGVDSSVTATLLTKALGRENVLALIMPHKETSKSDVEDAVEVARLLGISYKVINIGECVKSIIESSPWLTKLIGKVVRGNSRRQS